MLTLSDLFDLLEKIEARVDRYWNFYTLVVLAVAGWLFATGAPMSTAEARWIAVGLSVFFAANLAVIVSAETRLIAIEKEIAAQAQEAQFSSAEFRHRVAHLSLAQRRIFSVALHLIIDVALISIVLTQAA